MPLSCVKRFAKCSCCNLFARRDASCAARRYPAKKIANMHNNAIPLVSIAPPENTVIEYVDMLICCVVKKRSHLLFRHIKNQSDVVVLQLFNRSIVQSFKIQ